MIKLRTYFTSISFNNIARNCLNYLIPCICVLCGSKTHNNFNICPACKNDLPLLGCDVCKQCGKNCAPHETLCNSCLQQPPPYDRMIALYHYQPPIDHLILGLKFGNRLTHAKLLGTLLAQHLQQHYEQQHYKQQNHNLKSKPEIIIPVPLHNTRLRERGYNQALEIARPISRLTHIPINTRFCQRIKNTQAQSLLKAGERKKNMQDAFTIPDAIPGAVPYKHVAVIDDVITTGNTMCELCKQLKRAGIEQIDVWSCART